MSMRLSFARLEFLFFSISIFLKYSEGSELKSFQDRVCSPHSCSNTLSEEQVGLLRKLTSSHKCSTAKTAKQLRDARWRLEDGLSGQDTNPQFALQKRGFNCFSNAGQSLMEIFLRSCFSYLPSTLDEQAVRSLLFLRQEMPLS